VPADIALDDSQASAAPAEAERSLAWTGGVIAAITVLLALFSAASMRSWAETLPPTPQDAVIRQAAEGWSDLTERLGLAAPRAALHDAWRAARSARFDGRAADQR
jgi:hypothetical protein